MFLSVNTLFKTTVTTRDVDYQAQKKESINLDRWRRLKRKWFKGRRERPRYLKKQSPESLSEWHMMRRSSFAIALLVLTIILASCGTAIAREKSNPNVGTAQVAGLVPWIDSPSPVPPIPSPIPAAKPQTSAPPCKAADLALVNWGPSQLTGDHGIILELRNIGSATCLLSGTPKVIAKGTGVPDITATNRPMIFFGQDADTTPGKPVFLFVGVSAACAIPCQNPTIYNTLDIYYPMGGELVVHGLNLDSYCGMATTPFYSVKPGPQYPNPPTTNLVPTLKLPATVKAGTTLTYEVDISNPQSNPAELSPCPIYMEYSSFKTKLLYHLNCSAVHSIAPYGTVRYQMKMAIPASAPLGEASIYWVFFGPGNVGSNHLVIK